MVSGSYQDRSPRAPRSPGLGDVGEFSCGSRMSEFVKISDRGQQLRFVGRQDVAEAGGAHDDERRVERADARQRLQFLGRFVGADGYQMVGVE